MQNDLVFKVEQVFELLCTPLSICMHARVRVCVCASKCALNSFVWDFGDALAHFSSSLTSLSSPSFCDDDHGCFKFLFFGVTHAHMHAHSHTHACEHAVTHRACSGLHLSLFTFNLYN